MKARRFLKDASSLKAKVKRQKPKGKPRAAFTEKRDCVIVFSPAPLSSFTSPVVVLYEAKQELTGIDRMNRIKDIDSFLH
jgi:hypothetical protein